MVRKDDRRIRVQTNFFFFLLLVNISSLAPSCSAGCWRGWSTNSSCSHSLSFSAKLATDQFLSYISVTLFCMNMEVFMHDMLGISLSNHLVKLDFRISMTGLGPHVTPLYHWETLWGDSVPGVYNHRADSRRVSIVLAWQLEKSKIASDFRHLNN